MSRFVDWCVFLFFANILLVQFSCTPMEAPVAPDDKPLAKVFNKSLYLSELEGMTPAGSTPEDSALIINAYIERWIRETLLMHEAEKNIPKELNIDQLVRDYRASLVRYNYEKLLVDLQLDSTISQSELQAYYEKNTSKYQLDGDIARSYFIKVPLEADGLDELRGWWKKSDEKESYLRMVEYCTRYARVYMLEDSSWYKINDILAQLPKDKIKRSDIRSNRSHMVTDDRFQYFLKVFDTMSGNQPAPLNYVKEQITQVILHDRKIKLIAEKKEEIYERELRRNNIQIIQ